MIRPAARISVPFRAPISVHPPPPRPPTRWPLIAAVLIAAAGFAVWRRSTAPEAAFFPHRTARPRSGAIERTLRVSGSIASDRSATLLAPLLRGSRAHHSLSTGDFSLHLMRLTKSGSHVRAGDIVAEFDTQRMNLRLDDLRAEFEQRLQTLRGLEAQLASRRASLAQRIRVARGIVEKANLNLRTAPVRSAMQVERFRLARDEAQAQLHELIEQDRHFDDSERASLRREQLAQQIDELELRRAESNVDRMTLRSPVDGVLIPGNIQRGSELSEIAAGDEFRPGNPFLQVVDLGDLRLEATVNQADVEMLHIGARARVHVDSLPSVELPGRLVSVGSIAGGPRYRPGYVSNVTARIDIEKVDAAVLPNVSASADLVLASETAPVIVPRECVFAGHVYIRQAGEWQETPVELGLASHTEVVVHEGLSSSQEIACETPAVPLR